MLEWRFLFFTEENTPKGYTKLHKSSFSPYKYVSRKNGDHEWLRMINAFILCDLFEHFRQIMQETEKEVLTMLV